MALPDSVCAVPVPIASIPSLTALATEPDVVLSPFNVAIAESIPSISSLIASNVAESSFDKVPFKSHGLIKDKDGSINGKPKYARILIRNKHPQMP